MSSKNNKGDQPRRLGVPKGTAVYNLLWGKFPECRSKTDALSVSLLAKGLGISHETVYRMLHGDVITLGVAHKIVRFSEKTNRADRVYYQDLARFVFPEFEKYSDPLADLL